MTDRFPHPYSIANAKAFIEFATADEPVHMFAIDIDGKVVGGIGVHPQHDIYSKNAEIGYWLAEPHWGKGIVSRALNEIVEFAVATYDINRVFARLYGTNIKSQKVLEKAGFTLEARLVKTNFKNGEYLDELIYSVRR